MNWLVRNCLCQGFRSKTVVDLACGRPRRSRLIGSCLFNFRFLFVVLRLRMHILVDLFRNSEKALWSDYIIPEGIVEACHHLTKVVGPDSEHRVAVKRSI